MTDDIVVRARRRTTLVVVTVAATLLVAVLIVAGLVVLLGRPGTSAPDDVPDPETASMDVLPSTRSNPPVPPSASAATPGPAVHDLSWTTVAGARVPVSRSAGPRDLRAGRARGFAHNPLGAVLAAAHISLRLSPQAGPRVFGPTLREQVVGGNAAALGQQLDDEYEQARARLGLPYGKPAGRLYSTARGYRVDQDAPTTAEVRLLIEGPGKAGAPVLVELRVHTEWVGEDWTLVAPPGGTWDGVTALVTDTTGYTPFAGG